MIKFDELNALPKGDPVDIDTYFNAMELSDEEKRKRREFSVEFSDMLLFIFALFAVMGEYNYLDKLFIISQLKLKYTEIARGYAEVDKPLEEYIKAFAEEIIGTTIKHGADEYWTSADRAAAVSVNEALTTLGYSDLQDKIKQGYTRKRWVTERDNKVRRTHKEVDGVILPIEEPFVVGDSLMMYAHDAVTFGASAKELVNCRCTTIYEI